MKNPLTGPGKSSVGGRKVVQPWTNSLIEEGRLQQSLKAQSFGNVDLRYSKIRLMEDFGGREIKKVVKSI